MVSVAALLFILLLVFLLIRTPIAVALGLSTMVAVLVGGNYTLTYVAQGMIGAANSFPLLAIPFFILAGDLMGQGGISDRLLAVADAFLGRKYGGTAIVTVAVCMFFAAVSGSGPATVAAIGGITIPAMLRQKYDSGFASAISAIAGSIGCIIPPSIPMVVYCVATGASVSDLFLAGFIPGILIGVVLMIYSYFYSKKRGYINKEAPDFSWKVAGKAIWEAKWALIMPIIILGGIYAGIFTPTEAAAVAVAYGFIIGAFVHKTLDLKTLKNIFTSSTTTTAIIMFVICAATAFGKVLIIENIPTTVGAWIIGLTDNRFLLLLLINILLLIVGCFMEATSSMMILAPIFLPVIQEMDIDPIHFGIIMVINLSIGMATPPVGANLYVGCNISGCTIVQITKAVAVPVLLVVGVLMAVTYIEPIPMILVDLFG